MKTNRPYMYFAVSLASALLASCTSVEVRKVDARLHRIDHICIKENSRVKVDDFISAVEDGFMKYGISSEIVDGNAPERCKYVLTYTARRSWDVVPYLSYAEVKIRKGRRIIGSATYKHNGGSMSLALNKWAGTREKMDPVIDELLGEFLRGESVAPMGFEASAQGITLEKADDVHVRTIYEAASSHCEKYGKKSAIINSAFPRYSFSCQ